MYNGSNYDRKSQLSEILTEPVNSRELSAGLNLETLNTILSGTNNISAASQI